MRPSYHRATMPVLLQPAMSTLIGTDAPVTVSPKAKLTRSEAVRIAKARIMRRNSLQKQRQAQKG